MKDFTVTGIIGGSSVAIGGDAQAWLRLPDGIDAVAAVERGWIVSAAAPHHATAQLILCQRVTYCGGPKAGIYWEPVQLSSLPMADLP